MSAEPWTPLRLIAWTQEFFSKKGVDAPRLTAEVLLARGRVALHAGRQFGRGGIGHARVNFACSRELLTEAVDRMAAAVTAHAEQAGRT